jgi:hypothetical protein
MQFVIALLSMLASFTVAWAWLVIRRYQLARAEWQLEDRARRGSVAEARRAAVATPRVEEATR